MRGTATLLKAMRKFEADLAKHRDELSEILEQAESLADIKQEANNNLEGTIYLLERANDKIPDLLDRLNKMKDNPLYVAYGTDTDLPWTEVQDVFDSVEMALQDLSSAIDTLSTIV